MEPTVDNPPAGLPAAEPVVLSPETLPEKPEFAEQRMLFEQGPQMLVQAFNYGLVDKLDKGIYTEVHVDNRGRVFVAPIPVPMTIHWASIDGYHSALDVLCEDPRYQGLPNELQEVISHLNSSTVAAKGYLTENPDSQEQEHFRLLIDNTRGSRYRPDPYFYRSLQEIGIEELANRDQSVTNNLEALTLKTEDVQPSLYNTEMLIDTTKPPSRFSGIVNAVRLTPTGDPINHPELDIEVDMLNTNGLHHDIESAYGEKVGILEIPFQGHLYQVRMDYGVTLADAPLMSLRLLIDEAGQTIDPANPNYQEFKQLMTASFIEAVGDQWLHRGLPEMFRLKDPEQAQALSKEDPNIQAQVSSWLEKAYHAKPESFREAEKGRFWAKTEQPAPNYPHLETRLIVGTNNHDNSARLQEVYNLDFPSFFASQDNGKSIYDIPFWRQKWYSIDQNQKIVGLRPDLQTLQGGLTPISQAEYDQTVKRQQIGSLSPEYISQKTRQTKISGGLANRVLRDKLADSHGGD